MDPGLEKTGANTVFGTNTNPTPTKFPLHFSRFVLTHTRIRWASGQHRNFVSSNEENCPTKDFSTHKCQSPKDWRPISEGGSLVSGPRTWEDGNKHTVVGTYMNPTPLNSLYILARLSLSSLESSGRAADTETPYLEMNKIKLGCE